MPRLPPLPDLAWRDDGVLTAAGFGDVYFSVEGGLAESEAVFLAGCGLPQRWAGRDRFSILELGFGTGLNALAVWQYWRRSRRGHAQLHMVSIEAFPLPRADAQRALAEFPEIAPLAEKLLARWPVRAYAPQRLWFPEDGFALTLLTGEAERVLPHLSGQFDAFFLDGFAPARNESMWSDAVFQRLAALAAPDAQAATFTVAGGVRRGLEAAGFQVEKMPGHGRKRERLEAKLSGAPAPGTKPPARVAVIGAGIAGAAVAHALAKRNIETVVLEVARELGAGASGNPAGLVMPRLDRGDGPMRELHLAAYLDAVAAYEALGVFTPCGVEERPHAARGETLADLLADPPLPNDWLSALPNGAALHARGGLVDPLAAIRAFTANTTMLFESPVSALERTGDAWVLRAPDTRALLKADAVVLSCGAGLTLFEPARALPLRLTRGQLEWGKADTPLTHAIASGGYVAPWQDGVLFGATFDKTEDATTPIADEDSRQRNLEALRQLAPNLCVSDLHSRASLRCAAPDMAPIAGPLPDAEQWHLRNAPGKPIEDVAFPGLYVLGALGSRGLTLAPLLGETLAAAMCGEPHILSAKTLAAIHPARFLHRALKRGG